MRFRRTIGNSKGTIREFTDDQAHIVLDIWPAIGFCSPALNSEFYLWPIRRSVLLRVRAAKPPDYRGAFSLLLVFPLVGPFGS